MQSGEVLGALPLFYLFYFCWEMMILKLVIATQYNLKLR